MKAKRVWFGNVAFERGYCYTCKQMALVVDGLKQCCDMRVETEIIGKKRMSEPVQHRHQPSKKVRKELLEQYNDSCAYCERRFGSATYYHGRMRTVMLNWDHKVPYVYNQNNAGANFLPACRFCNLWKSSKMFQTVEEVKVYVAIKWQEEGTPKQIMPSLQLTIRGDATLEAVLQPKVCVGGLEQAQSTPVE